MFLIARNRLTKRTFRQLAPWLLLAATVQAQTAWPAKPVTLVVPFAAGGGTDIGGRCRKRRYAR